MYIQNDVWKFEECAYNYKSSLMLFDNVVLNTQSSFECFKAFKLRALVAVVQVTFTVTSNMVSPCVLLTTEKAFEPTF